MDPYYLLHKARSVEVDMDVLKSSRMMNDWMPYHLIHRIERHLKDLGKSIEGSRVLVMGVTFKPDVSDVRNSKVLEMLDILLFKGVQLEVIDPIADRSTLRLAEEIEMVDQAKGNYDVMIHAVGHQAFLESDPLSLEENLSDHSVIMDISGQWRVHQEWFQGIYEAL